MVLSLSLSLSFRPGVKQGSGDRCCLSTSTRTHQPALALSQQRAIKSIARGFECPAFEGMTDECFECSRHRCCAGTGKNHQPNEDRLFLFFLTHIGATLGSAGSAGFSDHFRCFIKHIRTRIYPSILPSTWLI